MQLQPIICDPEAAKSARVQALVDYCRELDGTEVRVLKISKQDDADFIAKHPVNTFYSMQAFSLRREALAMEGRPFIHLEPDAIPLKPGWVQALSDEYQRHGKPYMMAVDSHPPGDLVGGIGVYGPDTATEIPYQFEHSSWDLWMIQNIREKIAFSPLIQHKYGIYDSGGVHKVRNLRFPLDRELIRPEAVLFHRDPSQGLIPSRQGDMRFLHSGCIGDTIAALPSIRQLGGGHLVMSQLGNKRILRGERYEFVRPLLEAQPYIKSVSWEEEPQDIDYDFTNFRTLYKGDVSLAETQARYMGIEPLDESPWLSIDPDPRASGRIIVARSPRYQNYEFPWRQIAKRQMARLLFIGFADERTSLEARMGGRLDFVECKDALEMARLIAGSILFIGNQSSPYWIAAGLGKKLIQETYLPNPDSRIERPNAIYWQNQQQTKAALHALSHP